MIKLHQIKFSQKIAALSIIPITGLLLLASFSIEKQVSEIKAFENLIDLADFSVTASALVHELQKERGMSSLFLGSSGKEFGQEILQQRAVTDQKRLELKDYLSSSQRHSTSIDTASLATVKSQLDQIVTIRDGVSQLSIPAKKAIEYYTTLNEEFLQMIAQLPQLSSSVEMAAKLAAYSNFLKGKERTGIERAILSSTFANDAFAPGMYEKLVTLSAAQDTYHDVFFSFAPAAYKKLLQEKTTGSAFSETLAMREKALSGAGKGPFGIDPKYWFKMQTAKINVFKDIEDILAKDIISTAEQIEAAAHRKLWFESLFITLIVAVSAALFLVLRKDIGNQIGGEPAMVQEIAANIAAGQLERRITGKDEKPSFGIFAAMQSMQRHLAEVINTISASAVQIAQASNEVSNTAQALSQSNSQQAASLELTSSALEQLTGSVENNRENAKATEKIAVASAESAITGSQAVKETVMAMKNIATKIAVIEEIAYQTNLLSLNASIVAAKAGSHGAGFQVVASEVRKLAVRSQTTATEINELVANSVDISKRAGHLLDEMLPNIQKTSDLVGDIAGASVEQAIGVRQIYDAINKMNGVTQQNAAASEELAATAEELNEQSQRLMHEVGFFRMN